jgi:hypothetical protein
MGSKTLEALISSLWDPNNCIGKFSLEAGKRVAKKLGVTAASNKSHDGLGRVDAFFVIFE